VSPAEKIVRHIPRIFLNVFFLLCLSLTGCLPANTLSRNPSTPRGKILITFTYEGKAKSVCVCGDFNQWSPKRNCMKREGNRWTVRIPLSPGRYRYLFLIDNKRWIPDPKAYLNEKDGFGRKNSILIVEGT